MREAGKVESSEKSLSTEQVDELKFGLSYVRRGEDGSEGPKNQNPTEQVQRSGKLYRSNAGTKSIPAMAASDPTAPVRASSLTQTQAQMSVDSVGPMAPQNSASEPSGLVMERPSFVVPAAPLSVLQGAVEADPAFLDEIWDDERAARARRRRHNRVRAPEAARRAAHIARISRMFSLYEVLLQGEVPTVLGKVSAPKSDH